MADKKITELASYSPTIDTDLIPIVDITTSTTKKVAISTLKTTFWTSPVIVGTMTVSAFVGGTGVGDKITYKSTTGVGTTAGIAHQFIGGNNGATVIMTMLNSGNVGIGTTNPVFKLQTEVNSAETSFSETAYASAIGITNNNTTVGNLSAISFSQISDGFRGSGIAGIHVDRTAGARVSDLAFYTMTGNTPTEKVRILGNGNVGIGTTTPGVSLDVNGTVRFGATTGGTYNGNIVFQKDDTYPSIQFRSTNTVKAQIITNVNSGSIYYDLLGSFNMRGTINGGNTLFTVLNSGNVGIGTTSPTAVLHLKAGTATASTAPLKFTKGTLLTTPELGAMEFVDNTTDGHLYITLNVAGVLTRVQIV